jgi:hypothetical protein
MNDATPHHFKNGEWFRSRMREVGIGDRALAQRMIMAGDHREPSDVLLTIQQIASGELEVTSEMMALLQAIGDGGETQGHLLTCQTEVDRLTAMMRGFGYDPATGKP